VAAVLCLLPVVACSGGGGDEPAASPTSSTTSSSTPTTTPPPSTTSTPPPGPKAKRWPLTGWPRNREAPDHPVYVVKVDNTSSAAPQLGLDDADMVVEEMVEGGLVRLAAFYYSKLPEIVGPVRSIRASDIGITEPAHAFIVASGAAPKTMMLLNEADINRVTEGARGFYRSSIRSAPYNLMMRLTALAKHVGRPWTPPRGLYLPFGPADAFHGTTPVTSFSAAFSGAHTTDWRLQGDEWVRTNSLALSGHDFHATNVLILRVQVGDAGYVDPGGNPVPETFFYGSGAATLIHGNRAVTGTWHKDGERGVVRLTANGKALTVPAGHTFIELVPANGGSVTLRH
jgi:hypothetical protein